MFGNTRPVTLKMGIFATDEKLNILDMQMIEDNIYNLVGIAEEYIFKNMRWRAHISKGEREEIPEIPLAVIREVLANSFAHAMYNGYTEDAVTVFSVDLPYLKSVKSGWDERTSSAFRSTTTMNINDFYSKLGLEYSDNFDVQVLKRSSTNRIITISVNGKEFSARTLYDKLSLKSTDFSLKRDGDKVIIDTVGF